MVTAQESRAPSSAPSWVVLAAWLVANRVLLLLLGFVALSFYSRYVPAETWRALPSNLWLDGWLRWDAGWYMEIAGEGYQPVVTVGKQHNTAFFPLLPLLTAALGLFVRDLAVAGLLITNSASIVASIVLFRLVKLRWGATIAARTLLLLYSFPFSLYLSSYHTEPLFLCLAVCSFYYAERQSFWKAAFFAAAASATRNIGVLLFFGLGIAYLGSIRYDLRRLGWDSLFLLLCPLGLLLHMGFLWTRYGTPLQFVYSQAAPGWAGAALASAERSVFDRQQLLSWGVGAVVYVFPAALLLWRARRSIPASYLVWTAVMLLISMSNPGSFGRFLVVIFPVFVAAAMLPLSRRAFAVLLGISTVLLSIATVHQALGLWVAG